MLRHHFRAESTLSCCALPVTVSYHAFLILNNTCTQSLRCVPFNVYNESVLFSSCVLQINYEDYIRLSIKLANSKYQSRVVGFTINSIRIRLNPYAITYTKSNYLNIQNYN